MTSTGETMSVLFQDYINKYAVSKGSPLTHTSMSPQKSYYIPVENMQEFYNVYSTAFQNSENLHVTEAHRYVSPLLIDLDFKKESGDKIIHLYTKKHIENIVTTYCECISEAFYIKDPIEAYVMEKTNCKLETKTNTIKDGLHIVFPNIVCRANVQYAIRDHVMPIIADIIADIGCKNDIEDIIDKAVIEKNNWLMYGSKKPDGEPYLVTHAYKYSTETSDLISGDPNEHDTLSLVTLFSIRNKYDETPMTSALISKVRELDTLLETKRNKESLFRNIVGKTINVEKQECVCIDTIRQLIDILNTDRAIMYNDWIRLGWCLKNIDDNLLDKWDEFSKNSPKYVPGECRKLWQYMKKGGLGYGTLHMWAKKDNPVAYKDIVRKDLQELIFQSRTGTHNDVARVIYHMYQHEYVCSSIKYKMWYEFKFNRWYASDSAFSLRLKISNDVWREYVAAARDWSQKALDATTNENQTIFQETAKKMSEIALKLKNTSFKDNIMKECAEIFYKDGFENELDQNLNLICFNNGVYDLDMMEFREGRPEDMISFGTNNDYVPFDPSCKYSMEIKNYLAQVLTRPNVREYVLKLFSTFLHGAVKEQKFYIWTGSGSNSKSKLIELFEYSFGDYCCKFPITLLTQKRAASNAATSELARAKGKRFACLQEPSEDEKINIGLMKELSGGDKILARAIYKEPVEFKPQFKLLLLCNHLPSVPSDDGGTWRRIRVVEFTSKFVDNPKEENEFPIDLELGEKIEKWKLYFIPMLLDYYKLYKSEGLLEPEDVLSCTRDYKRNNDHIADFIHNCIEKESSSFLSLNDAFLELKSWVKDDNIPLKIPTKPELEKQLSKNLNKCLTRNNFKGFKGYKLKNRYSENLDDDF
jgi:P4 family phage/plasmid primase-like protien